VAVGEKDQRGTKDEAKEMETMEERLGSTIRQIRTKRGFTQAEAARRADVSSSYWAMIEQGKRSPNLAVLESIGRALGVPASILVFLSGRKDEFEKIDRSIAERMALLSWKLIDQDIDSDDRAN
jgi:transcriptional regulator with XRE-family HTH domain